MSEREPYDPSIYDRPSVTVDLVIFTLIDGELHLLLVERKNWPFAGNWAIPGGFVRMDESLEAAARRELEEKTGIADVYLEQLFTFGEPERDPRTRVISIAYIAVVRADRHHLVVSPASIDVRWQPVARLPQPLAFDHDQIVTYAVQRLESKFEYTTLAFELLPPEFTLAELYEVYGQIFGGQRRNGDTAQGGEWEGLDKRNFYRKITDAGILQDTGRFRRGSGRPAKLYTFQHPTEANPFVFRWREAKLER